MQPRTSRRTARARARSDAELAPRLVAFALLLMLLSLATLARGV